jgi:hypothetical protein
MMLLVHFLLGYTTVVYNIIRECFAVATEILCEWMSCICFDNMLDAGFATSEIHQSSAAAIAEK